MIYSPLVSLALILIACVQVFGQTLVPELGEFFKVRGESFRPNKFCNRVQNRSPSGALAIHDGTQQRDGSCSSMPQGLIPSVYNMVGTIIVEPENAATIPVGQDFTVKIKTRNLDTGYFADSSVNYYGQAQTLNADGIVQGHQHITVQRIMDVGDKASSIKEGPDAHPDTLHFFKGLNDREADGKTLEVKVDGFKSPGIYRICSMTGAFTHQPVLMPVAKRGAQDDCIRVTVPVSFNSKRRRRWFWF